MSSYARTVMDKVDLKQMLVIIMECVSWVCEDALWEHEWVTEPNVL